MNDSDNVDHGWQRAPPLSWPAYAGGGRGGKSVAVAPSPSRVDAFQNDRRRSRPPASKASRMPDGRTPKLHAFLTFLTSPQTRTTAAQLLKTAYESNMVYKRGQYTELMQEAHRDVERERTIARNMQRSLRDASGAGEGDQWSIFEKVSQPFIDAQRRIGEIEIILAQITENLSGAGVGNGKPPAQNDDIYRVLRELVDAADYLSNFGSQPHVVDAAIEIVEGFLKNSASIRTKFLNFLMVGGAGVGKTTLVKAIAKLFASCGMFVGNRVREAGRAEFIGEYEGQTVARTRAFLTSSLDCGVVFIDEAYAMTPWDKGKPEGYGSEAVSALVEFTTRYKGLYCIMCAGYEKEMRRYFMATNPGLPRRFPFRMILNDFDVGDLVFIFKQTLLKELGQKVANGRDEEVVAEATRMFTPDAWDYLYDLLVTCRQGRTVVHEDEFDASTKATYHNVPEFVPKYALMYAALVENQAGSMTNLAEEAANRVVDSVSLEAVAAFRKKAGRDVQARVMPSVQGLSLEVMREIVSRRLQNTAMSDWPAVKREHREVEKELGLPAYAHAAALSGGSSAAPAS